MIRFRDNITHAQLVEALRYEPHTGQFYWRTARSNVKAGDPAGTKAGGYINISVDGVVYRAHRLAWLYMTGAFPTLEIDHRDLNRANNRWANLRLATNSQNKANRRANKNGTSGYKGVSFYPKNGRWQAQIMAKGRRYHLGYFSDAEAAHAAYLAKAKELHGSFARAS